MDASHLRKVSSVFTSANKGFGRLKIGLLGPANSIHLVRWANAFATRRHEVHVLSAHGAVDGYDSRVTHHRLPWSAPAGYFLNAREVGRLSRRLGLDVLNTHYASGYGTLMALSSSRPPTLLNVWGADVFDFPEHNRAFHWLIRRNLRRATAVASTSEVMARQVRKIDPSISEITVTPFGVDLQRFRPRSARSADGAFVVGTVKTLSAKYGIDLLLRAFAFACGGLESEYHPLASRLRLTIVGDGPDRAALESLAAELGIAERTTFLGARPHAEVPSLLHQFDVYAALSRLDSESFGVAIVEASASALPVVVSDVGGLPEVVDADRSGIVVPREDPRSAASALVTLAKDPSLRESMGRNGRLLVEARYDWERNVDGMLARLERLARGTLAP